MTRHRFAKLAGLLLALIAALRPVFQAQDVEVLVEGSTVRATWGTILPAHGALEVAVDPDGPRAWTMSAPAARDWQVRTAELRDVPAGAGTITLRGVLGLPLWWRAIPRHREVEPGLALAASRLLVVTVPSDGVRAVRLFHGNAVYSAVYVKAQSGPDAPPCEVRCALLPGVDHGTLAVDVEHEAERRLVTRVRIGAQALKLLESSNNK